VVGIDDVVALIELALGGRELDLGDLRGVLLYS
jgi:hypothetical protein